MNNRYDNGVAGSAWDEEVEAERARANLAQLTVTIPSESNELRSLPTAKLARDWHRGMVLGIEIPDDAYRGGFRGDFGRFGIDIPHGSLIRPLCWNTGFTDATGAPAES
jgi:hypothetical protein